MRKCDKCRTPMMQERGNHLYDSSGLQVTLVDVKINKCPECGNSGVAIPRIAQLNRAIAAVVVHKKGRLSFSEVRFLRKILGWSSADFAETVGVDATTVSRWENGKQTIGPQADRLLRMLVVHESPIPDYAAHDLRNADGEGVERTIPLRFEQSQTKSWTMVA